MKRTAACSCGALRIAVSGEPAGVYICGCRSCRPATGSVFAWRARWPGEAVTAIRGEARRWRRTGDAGRWVEHVFCPTCGALVWMTGEALGDDVAVSVGAFEDLTIPRPGAAYRTTLLSAWLAIDSDIRVVS